MQDFDFETLQDNELELVTGGFGLGVMRGFFPSILRPEKSGTGNAPSASGAASAGHKSANFDPVGVTFQ